MRRHPKHNKTVVNRLNRGEAHRINLLRKASVPSAFLEMAHNWETVKENAQPRRRGRAVAKLNVYAKESAASVNSGRAERLKAQRDQLEAAAAQAWSAYRSGDASAGSGGGDPLLPWLRYVKWTEAEYPSRGKGSAYVQLLERCTRKFKDEERYRNDKRYLRVWIKYADALDDPTDVFRYLYSNGIGEDLALFYVAWAFVVERAKNYALADKIYTRGKNRLAQPVEELKEKHRQFQRRMSRVAIAAQQQVAGGGGDLDDDLALASAVSVYLELVGGVTVGREGGRKIGRRRRRR